MNPAHTTKAVGTLWPWAITAAFGLFISGTVGLIVLASTQKVELVSPDYYEQEIRFQRHIDRVRRTEQSGARAAISYDAASQRIRISLSPGEARRGATGRIQLYRPASAGLDRCLKLELDSAGVQALDAKALAPGLWQVRLSWTEDGAEYFAEQRLVIPNPRRT